jgi:hypothetical protein
LILFEYLKMGYEAIARIGPIAGLTEQGILSNRLPWSCRTGAGLNKPVTSRYSETDIGMQVLVFPTETGDHVVIEPGAKLIGVKVAPGRYVPALSVITKQTDADALPIITQDYLYRNLNAGVIRVNIQLAEAPQPQAISR